MNEFQAMLKTAKANRERFVSQRNELNHKIAALDKTIEGLSTICEPAPEKPSTVALAISQAIVKYAGLTDVVRMALQASNVRLSANAILSLLEQIAYPLERFDNPRANVNMVLTRLVANEEIDREPGPEVTYKWIGKETNLPKVDFWEAIKGLSEPARDAKKK